MKLLPQSAIAQFEVAQKPPAVRPAGQPELEQSSPQFRSQPEVLEWQCKAYASARQWYPCLSVADRLTDLYPSRVSGWLLLAQAQDALNRTADACETLLAVLDRFPENPELPYQLARYGCKLGWVREARKWLDQALAIDGSTKVKVAAIEDPALRVLQSGTRGRTQPQLRA